MFLFLGSELTLTGRKRRPAKLAQQHIIGQDVEEEEAHCPQCSGSYSADVQKGNGNSWIQCSRCLLWYHNECVKDLLIHLGKDKFKQNIFSFWCDGCCDEEAHFERQRDLVNIQFLNLCIKYLPYIFYIFHCLSSLLTRKWWMQLMECRWMQLRERSWMQLRERRWMQLRERRWMQLRERRWMQLRECR